MLTLLCVSQLKKHVMGLSELIFILVVGSILFTPVGMDGFITGFKEGMKKNKLF